MRATRPLILVGIVCALGILAVAVRSLSRVVARAPQVRSTPASADGRKWGPAHPVPIQLGPYPEGGVISRTVPPGVSLSLTLWTRAPASRMRIEAREANRPPTRQEIPAANPGTIPAATGPECAPARQAIEALLAARRVAEADRAERDLEAAGKRVRCAELDASARMTFGLSRIPIHTPWQLAAGEDLLLTLQEMDTDGRTTATWQVKLTAQAPGGGWAHASEQEWLAAAVIRDIYALMSLASGATEEPSAAKVRTLRQTPSGTLVVQVEVTPPGRPALSLEIAAEPHVFAPKAYDGFARAAFASLQVQATRPEPSAGLVDRLTDLRAVTLKKESDRVGLWLSRRPLDPAGNEEAALIHLALALRENAVRFTDIRPSVARATAHLTVAGLTDGPSGVAGRLAHTVLQVLIGRQAEVFPSLQASLADPKVPAAERAWARALLLRMTDDWRLAPAGQRLTLIEDLQLFRARRASQGGPVALESLERQAPAPVPDWSWIVLANANVEEGNIFSRVGFPATLAEFATTVLGKDPQTVGSDEVASALQPTAPASAVTWSGKGAVEVLGRSTWTAFFVRHLMHTADAADEHFYSSLGDPSGADASAARIDPYFRDTPWSLALEPSRLRRRRHSRPPGCGAFLNWVEKRPETVPASTWNRFVAACPNSGSLLPQMKPWFAGLVIPGTALGLAQRTETTVAREFETILGPLRALAPYDADVAQLAIVYGGKQGDAKAIEDAYGARKEYSTSVLWRIANAEKANPERRRPLLERLCEISTDECVPLAEDYAAAREDAKAVAVYEKLLEGARDRVLISSEMDWLVGHYLDAGKAKDALRVAQAAAEVGSQFGLELLATALERLERLSEAESVLKSAEERYNERESLDLFYMRAEKRPKGKVFADRAQRARERYFPNGLHRAALSDFREAPKDGVLILDDTSGVRELGMARGDVIVALDGYRTQTFGQYKAVRGFTLDQGIELIAWSMNRRAYVTAKGRFVNRRFGSTLSTYPQ